MNLEVIREKFGDDYIADENTFKMGIDRRFTTHFAERFAGKHVLETCTGAGFTTISLAQTASSVFTVEINQSHLAQAISNVKRAGFINKVTFFHGNISEQKTLNQLPLIDAAFIDPDWADAEPDHEYRFINSSTQPPADVLLYKIFEITENVAIVLPPFIDNDELDDLPKHERQKLFLGQSFELYCLYFGNLIRSVGTTVFKVPI